MTRSQAIYLLQDSCFDDVYGPEERETIADLVDVVGRLNPEKYRVLPEDRTWPQVEIILASWGMPRMDDVFLHRFPSLRVVLYGAGSIRSFATEAMWNRGIRVSCASAANAVPVAEFSLSQILYALKQGWRHAAAMRERRAIVWFRPPGGYRSTVGLLSLGVIGRLVAGMLRNFDLEVIAYDPFVSSEEAAATGIEMVGLDEVFRRADVISCHTPLLAETERMLRERHFAAMRPDATFLNTARGELVDETGLIATLEKRPDLTAILDVTAPEPPAVDSPLYRLPNVVLTPHIAGSMARECRRMGKMMTDDLSRYLAGQPLCHEIDERQAAILA